MCAVCAYGEAHGPRLRRAVQSAGRVDPVSVGFFVECLSLVDGDGRIITCLHRADKP